MSFRFDFAGIDVTEMVSVASEVVVEGGTIKSGELQVLVFVTGLC